MCFVFACVNTCKTPGTARALAASILVILPRAIGLETT
jgi:hypothetical protein